MNTSFDLAQSPDPSRRPRKAQSQVLASSRAQEFAPDITRGARCVTSEYGTHQRWYVSCLEGHSGLKMRSDLPQRKTEAAVGVGGVREPGFGGGAEPEPASESSHLGVQLFMRSGGQIFTRLC